MSISNSRWLTLTGAGPLIVIPTCLFTLFLGYACLKGRLGECAVGCHGFFLAMVGACCFGVAAFLFSDALLGAKIISAVRERSLRTDGVYSLTRNPLYAAWLFGYCGFSLLLGNLLMLLISSVCSYAWLLFVIVRTEEPALLNLYGSKYAQYLKTVNRVIPWPSRVHCSE